jgi:hypothetical protein
MAHDVQRQRTYMDRRAFLKTAGSSLASAGLAVCLAAARRPVSAGPLPLPPAQPDYSAYSPSPSPTIAADSGPAIPGMTSGPPPAPSPQPAPAGSALDLAPASMTIEMLLGYVAIDDSISQQAIERQFRGRVFVDRQSGATIILSQSAFKALTAEATRIHFAAVYLSEEDAETRDRARVLIDQTTGITTLVSRTARQSVGAVVPNVDDMLLSIQKSEHGRLLARHAGLSSAGMVIIDDRDGQPFAFLPRAGSGRISEAPTSPASHRSVASILSRTIEDGIVGSTAAALPPLDGNGAGFRYLWDDLVGRPCAVDDYGVAAVYDVTSNRWQRVPLDEDIPASYCERARTTIKENGRLMGIVRPDGTVAEHAIRALPAGNGTSSIFMVMAGPAGSPFGLSPDQPYADWVASSFATLNQVDAGIENTMQSYGVYAVTGDIPPCDFTNEREKSWAATFNPERGVIEINQKAEDTVKGVSNVMATLLLETRNIAFRRGLVDKLDPNQGVDKGLFVKSWADAHKDRLGAAAYNQIVYRANYTIAWYKQNLP